MYVTHVTLHPFIYGKQFTIGNEIMWQIDLGVCVSTKRYKIKMTKWVWASELKVSDIIHFIRLCRYKR